MMASAKHNRTVQEFVRQSLAGFRERQILRDARRASDRERWNLLRERGSALARLETARPWLTEQGIGYRETVAFGITVLRLRVGLELAYRPDGCLDRRLRPPRPDPPPQAELF